MIKSIIQLLRPHQWLKNLFIFLPLFFDRQLTDLDKLLAVVGAFVAYSLAASAIYCFNDIWDVEADRQHPKKCKRPIASGKISKGMGYGISAILVTMSLLLLVTYTGREKWYLFGIICFYLLLNIAYCVKLKQITIIDVFIIAFGFVLRIFVGGVAVGIHLSHWIILMTFLVSARKNVNRYNLEFMNQTIGIIASITMVCYIMYTVSEEVVERMHTQYLYATSVFVLAGIVRYLQITIVDVKSGSPTKVLMKDRFVQLCIIGWILTFILRLYC